MSALADLASDTPPSVSPFGRLSNGETVEAAVLSGGGLTARIITFGASLQDLRLAGHAPPLVLGLNSAAEYEHHGQWFGAIAGRVANRIAGAQFKLDGERYKITANEPSGAVLHSGPGGTGTRNWTIAEQGADFVRMMLLDPDGNMGFPGNLTVSCTWSLPGDGVLRVELVAESDKACPVNLAQHAYFNLDDGGASACHGHKLQIAAGTFLPVDQDGIPLGPVQDVTGTPHDFQRKRPIQIGAAPFGHDHNFCLDRRSGALRFAARAAGRTSGLAMDLYTTEPGLQFYAGQWIKPEQAGLDGLTYGPWSGFCLEPQGWPDAVNHPDFPSQILRPGEIYRQVSEMRFSKA